MRRKTFDVRREPSGSGCRQCRRSHISRLTSHVSLLTSLVLLSTRPAPAGLLGPGEFYISVTPGAWFPDVAYNSVNEKYFVVWADYGFNPVRIRGRFVTHDGAVSGSVLPVSDDPTTYKLFPAIAYNATNNEFLVTWDDGRGGDVIWGQRVRGSDGALLGSNFQIGLTGGIRSAVAWNALNNVYLVTWWGGNPIDVHGRRVSNTGGLLGSQLNISADSAFSGYPAVASDNGNQFLVTWDHSASETQGGIRGQRINAATGASVGAAIDVTIVGRENRSCIAFDPINSRWLVQFNQGNPGQSYDQYGQIVNTSGALVEGLIPIAATEGFEGDTQFGGDVAFAPQLGRYLSSFGTDFGMGAIESLASGAPVTPQTVILGIGAYTSLNNAADPVRSRFLTVWNGRVNEQASEQFVWGRLYEASDLAGPDPVQSFTAQPGSQTIRLSWTNPANADFTGTMIRFKSGSAPTGPGDGTLLIDKPNTPGSSDSYLHMHLVSGTHYHYSAFAHDARPNYAAGVPASAVAGTRGDFEPDGDVDVSDFGLLQRCLSGEAIGYTEGCAETDLDLDGDVDAVDLGLFLPCLNGANRSPGC